MQCPGRCNILRLHHHLPFLVLRENREHLIKLQPFRQIKCGNRQSFLKTGAVTVQPRKPLLTVKIFFRQNLDLLPGALPQALRSVSASLLTDLTALDLDTLDRTLEFLANNEAQIETQVLPGDEQAGRYTLNEESLAAVQSFFNVSPTDGQASSASEP